MVEEEEEKVEEVEERRHGAAGVQSIRGTRWETRAVPLFTIVTKKGHLHATLAPGRRRVTQGVWVNGLGCGGGGAVLKGVMCLHQDDYFYTCRHHRSGVMIDGDAVL